MEKITYADAGVNISEGNRAVELMKKKVRETYNRNVVGDIGLFAGGFALGSFVQMEEPVLLASTDGVGTKVMIAQEMDIHDTVGIDLVAMCVNDLICQGARPLFFLDYVATGKVDADKIATIVGGIADGCKESLCALIGGETAEMPGLYAEEEYDLAGFSVGIVDKKKIIDGRKIEEGDVVIGLQSSGLHSNGYSLARKIFFDRLGLKTDEVYGSMSETIGKALLRPTKLYVRTVLDLIEKFEIKGISNITGGGLIENVPRILPSDLDVVIDTKSWEYPELFRTILELDLVEKEELYRSFNMGVGMVLILSKEEADKAMEWINSNTDDRAFFIGRVDRGEKRCLLR
ncbi:phosphoribosylformylglycinamidine cyclo-ligase [Filifactor villosus]|uniref:Phosphoribosylformylglycinamidine cyclo-ligase n=1 Tax=Filifactor villosus TaxID=29374 RepID=A0ABV9QM22_9FIRM